jgi:type IV pilus assembly protein PilY1
MRVSWKRFGIASSSAALGLTALLWAPSAGAQLGAANVPLPNVLLLQDTSGSFEYMIDGKTPETPGEGGTCIPGTQSNPNRWGVAVQALTGNILPAFSCAAMDRSQVGFLDQYSISTGVGGPKAPYDYQYYLPFHRPVSLDSSTSSPGVACVYTPNALPGGAAGGVGIPPVSTSATDCAGSPCTALDFPGDAIATYPFISSGAALPVTGACAPAACANAGSQTMNSASPACTFSQAPNGALDGAATLMRFGLMTFDNDTGSGIGVTPSVASPAPFNTLASAFDGQWSYYSGWNLGTSGMTGWPTGCTATTPPPSWELGARNPAAPPWEGRLVNFPNQSADTTATVENNNLVQLAIASMRPYGATPLSAMFDDAEEYLWHDPTGPQKTDLFVQGGCRPEYIIVLTDGQPNQDLGVTEAAGTPGTCVGGGKCPYQAAFQAAASLYAGNDSVTGRSGQSVTTYVIGFAVSQNITPTIANCAQLASSGNFNLYCPNALPTDPQYPCCMLQQIAAAGSGGTNQAYFADTPGDLNAALGAVLGQIAKQLTSRTLPVYSSTVSYAVGAGGQGSTSMFLTNFNGATSPWQGDVQRQQILCQGSPLAPVRQLVNPVNGDDFGVNLQPATTSSASRKFLTYQLPAPGKGAASTIRPFDTSPTDGFIAFGQAGQEVGLSPANVSSMTNLATQLSATNSSCENPITHLYSIPAAGCAEVGLQFAMAQPTVTTGDTSSPSFDVSYATAAAPRTLSPLGAILHSTPALASPPGAFLRDDSYQAYATFIASLAASGHPRDPTLYVATTDGLLHAFDTVLGKTSNELWSFIPPGTFPNLIANYPAASSVVLDGAPVVKDVVWERDQGGSTATWTGAWHTMLVGGFGAGGRGYYALDVTDPRSTTYSAVSNYSSLPVSCASGTCTGPHFQWQIASMNLPGGPTNQNELFGTISATPAITTVYADPLAAGANPKEIGVAILPGGSNGAPFPNLPCQREFFSNPGAYVPPSTYNNNDETNFPIRHFVRSWAKSCTDPTSNGVPGRSVTVVRMDTGDILAVFARPPASSPDVPSELLAGKFIATPFDSPMTGTPIVYPSDVGSVAQQVFIGDADGTLWRIDLTSPNPASWRAAIFFDSYNGTMDKNYNLSDSNHAAYDSEAIVITPLTTLDRQGNLTIQVATGDQDSFTANYTVPGQPKQVYGEVNFVYSLKLAIQGSGPTAVPQSQVNWWQYLPVGERVTGPMVVFDDTFYFATFVPPNPATPLQPVCTGGMPKLWGFDYELPNPTCGVGPNFGFGSTGCGGNPRDFLPTGTLIEPPDDNGNPTVNVVIPGVAVAVTPSCTSTSAATTDQYTGGMQTGMSGTTAGTYSLVAQIAGKSSSTGAQNTITKQLVSPNSTTLVDSWAGLAE